MFLNFFVNKKHCGIQYLHCKPFNVQKKVNLRSFLFDLKPATKIEFRQVSIIYNSVFSTFLYNKTLKCYKS